MSANLIVRTNEVLGAKYSKSNPVSKSKPRNIFAREVAVYDKLQQAQVENDPIQCRPLGFVHRYRVRQRDRQLPAGALDAMVLEFPSNREYRDQVTGLPSSGSLNKAGQV
jgi:hypothetical protein